MPRPWKSGTANPSFDFSHFIHFRTDGRFEKFWYTSFSPKLKHGTSVAPFCIAILTNPLRFFSTKSNVPGTAPSDSSAPPTTSNAELPGGPVRTLFKQPFDASPIALALTSSRHSGSLNWIGSVCTNIFRCGNIWSKPVEFVAKLKNAPKECRPCG
eukprot:gene17499-biopygen17698